MCTINFSTSLDKCDAGIGNWTLYVFMQGLQYGINPKLNSVCVIYIYIYVCVCVCVYIYMPACARACVRVNEREGEIDYPMPN